MDRDINPPPVFRTVSTKKARECYLRRLPLPALPCRPIHVNPVRTSTHSATRPAEFTAAAVENPLTGLHKLWYCETMWTRLLAYVSMGENLMKKDDVALGGRTLYHLSNCPGVPREPPSAYEAGAQQMHLIECSLLDRSQPVVCNIEGIQDAVNSQIIDVLNAAMKMRYENKARDLTANTHYNNSADNKAPLGIVEANCFYPAWLRSCSQNHIYRSKGTSGFTDKMLFASPRVLDCQNPKHTQVALQEGKTPWVYKTKDLQDILLGSPEIINETGKFRRTRAETGHTGNLLLKQLWGECADLGPDAGFTTNGDYVMVFFRVRPQPTPAAETMTPLPTSQSQPPDSFPTDKDSGFILSPLMEWVNPDLRACLIALSFMTLDEESWLTRQVKNPITDQLELSPVSLRELLCPVDECEQILQGAQG
ncbi:hypothetical protein BDN70DRAFT_885114 [Pholiota conissans]|uniref:Uncharacterized protein n=1 Tax=Pholiota conissans TaxID=109636 RepID=A0A9P5YQV4_9AGAR|nr:hypothetical protein BDN70DRAFT_885114 [Pholiota conissans]